MNATLGGSTTDNHVTWTNLDSLAHHLLVNEPSQWRPSLLERNNVSDIKRFTFPAKSGTSVLGVVVWASTRKDDGGSRTIRPSIKSGSTTGTSGKDVALGSKNQYAMLQSLTGLNAGAPWPVAGVKATIRCQDNELGV